MSTEETILTPVASLEEVKLELMPVSELGLYGFTPQIIEDMKEFEIFPNTVTEDGVIKVHRGDIFGVVRMLLELNMNCYRASEQIEKAKEELAEILVRDGVKLDPETLQPISQLDPADEPAKIFSAEAQEA